MTQPHIGSGGFATGLKRTSIVADAGPNFLASEDFTVKRGGITLVMNAVPPDAFGRRIVPAGTFVVPSKPSADPTPEEVVVYGKYGMYDTDNPYRNTIDPDLSGFTLEAVDVTNFEVVCGLIIRGDLLAARLNPRLDALADEDDRAAILAAIGHRFTFQ